MNEIERELDRLARRQHQVFSRRQALDAGMSASALSRRIRTRTFVACGPSSLHFGGASLTFQGRLMAGLLDIDRPAVVSGAAAGRLLGLDGFERHNKPEYLVARNDRHRRANGAVHSVSELRPSDRWRVDRLPCASPTMTVIQLFAHGAVEDAANALDSACRKGFTKIQDIRDRYAQLVGPGRAGVARFELAVKAAAVESWLERRFVALLRSAGLPLPVSQVRHRLEGVGVVRVDFEFGLLPIVIEVGGRRGYLTRDERQQKERRRNALQLAGKTVYFFTRNDVVHDPAYVVATVAGALGMRVPVLRSA